MNWSNSREISLLEKQSNYRVCGYCECVSSLGDLFVKEAGKKRVACPRCHARKLSLSGRWKWLLVPVGIVLLEALIADSPDVAILYVFLFLAWTFVFTALAIVAHELAHYGVTRLLGGICPVVTFGEGTPLFSINTKETLWQFCPSPTLGIAYCAYPPGKRDVWRYVATFAAGGAINLVIAAVSLYFARSDTGSLSFYLYVNTLVNGIFFISAFFIPALRPGLRSDGQQIYAILRDRAGFFGPVHRQYQIVLALALVWREKSEELSDYIRSCDDFEGSAVLCNLLGYSYAFRFQFDSLLHWGERSLTLLEEGRDSTVPDNDQGRLIRAMSENNIAFALYCLGSEDSARMLSLAQAAFDKLPWEPAVAGTYAAVNIRCGDVSEGLALLERQITNERDLSNHNLALTYVSLAEGYQKANRQEDMKAAMEKVRSFDPAVFDYFRPMLAAIRRRQLGPEPRLAATVTCQ